jgi:hypothetical protein
MTHPSTETAVQTTPTNQLPAVAAGPDTPTGQSPAVMSRSAATLASLKEWRAAQLVAMEAMADLVWTDIVPLAHWAMPPGHTLKSYPDPRRRYRDESDADYQHRIRTTVAAAAAIVLRGYTFGMDPPQALESMFVIRGKVGMYTRQRQALATAAGIETGDVEWTPQRVTCYGIHPISYERVEITISMADAERAGWTKDNANYQKVPADMLWARAMGRVLDRCAGHVLAGVVSIDDARDWADQVAPARVLVSAEDIAAALPPQATAAARETAAAAAPGPLSAAVRGNVSPEPEPASTVSQRRRIQDRFVVLGQSVKGLVGTGQTAARQAVIASVVGHDVASMQDLTEPEANLVIDHLAGSAGERLAGEILAGLASPARAPDSAPAPSPAAAPEAPETAAVPDEPDVVTNEPAAAEYDPTSDETDPWRGLGES